MTLQPYAQTNLPTVHGTFKFLVFRDQEGIEHVALVKGEIQGQENVLCRIHSECMTGEVFGSIKCDCRLQLDSAIKKIERANCGLLIYLRQEGRGVGLGNKIRAYAMQEKGADTVDANLMLGLPADARNYHTAAEIIKSLGAKSIQLLTNNPAKIESLSQKGVQVVKRIPLVLRSSKEAHSYLKTKQDKMGHILEADD